MEHAAVAAIEFLHKNDRRVGDVAALRIQGDGKGQLGDVRDIVLVDQGRQEIGISAKHHHMALKHSRLSDKIDFGSKWYGVDCSNEYWRRVNPVFERLRESPYAEWSNLPDKVVQYYHPILDAFIDEVRQHARPAELLRYVVGRYDFYKTVKRNGEIKLQSFNANGTLDWGDRLPMPTRVIEFMRVEHRLGVAELIMDQGWQVSFRIHNASSKIEPSLKFDIQLVGQPQAMASYSAPYAHR